MTTKGHSGLYLIETIVLFAATMATSDLEKMGPTRTSTNNKAPSEGGKTEAIIDNKADVALQYLAEHGRVEYTPEEERTVRWRIDLFLLPVVRQFLSRAPNLGATLTGLVPTVIHHFRAAISRQGYFILCRRVQYAGRCRSSWSTVLLGQFDLLLWLSCGPTVRVPFTSPAASR